MRDLGGGKADFRRGMAGSVARVWWVFGASHGWEHGEFSAGHGGEHAEFSAAIRRGFGEFSAQDLITNGSRRPPYYAAKGDILNCRRSRLLTGAEGAILNCAAQAALLIYEPPAEPAPYGRRRRLTVPLTIFCKRHGRPRPPPCNFDRAFDVFLQKARSVAPSAPQFRPCLWHFFAKGTVGRDPCSAVSTVPLAFFYKRHGRLPPPPRHFDRAFGVFLQKARSRNLFA